MSNNITIELCTADRERVDRLIAALERKSCDACVHAALNWSEQVNRGQQNEAPKADEPDPIREALTEVLAEVESPAEAPKNAAGATEAETPATTQATDESPAAAEGTGEAAPVVTVDDIRQRYVALVASGKKDEARDTIKSYNVAKISDIPADKCAEVLAKLNALEG